MKRFKLPLVIVAILSVSLGLFAFAPVKKEAKLFQWYKLKDGGTPTNRADWEPAGSAPACPTEHTEEVCRIYAEDDNDMPSEDSFGDVLTESDDFNQEAIGYVEYKEE